MPLRLLLHLAAAACLLAALPAHARTPVEFPVVYRDGFLWLKVSVAGQRVPLNFLFDSGAASSVVDSRVARRLGLKLGERVDVQGVHSRTTARRVGGFAAQTGGVALPDSPLAVDLRAISATCHQAIDGLLGADFFHDRIVQIDFAAGKVRLLDQAPAGSRCAALPLRLRHGAFCIPAGIGGSAPQWLRVDTGCDSAIEWAAGPGAAPRDEGASIGLASGRGRSMRADVQLGGHSLRAVEIGVHDRAIFSGEDGLLGNAALSRFRVTIDAPGGRLILESH